MEIPSGVGFLGAGVILRHGGRVIGLTTAATIWLVAALGMGLGGGQYALVPVMVGLHGDHDLPPSVPPSSRVE